MPPALWWSAYTVRGCWGFFFFFVRCDELSDFPPPRLKVQHIPGCTGQYDFNLFSQAGSTDRHNLVWNSSPTPLWGLRCLLVDIPEENQGWQPSFVSHMCSPSKHLSPAKAITSLHCHIFQEHRTDGTQSFVTAEKTKRKKKEGKKRGGCGDVTAGESHVLIQQKQIRAGVCLSLHRAESKCRIKCERHTKSTLKSTRRRRVVTPPRPAAPNDKEGGWREKME